MLTLSPLRRKAANTGPGFYLFLGEPHEPVVPQAGPPPLMTVHLHHEFGAGALACPVCPCGARACVYACSVLILPLGPLTVPLGTTGSVSLRSLHDSPLTVKGGSGEGQGSPPVQARKGLQELSQPHRARAAGRRGSCPLLWLRSSLCPPGHAQGGLAVNTSQCTFA